MLAASIPERIPTMTQRDEPNEPTPSKPNGDDRASIMGLGIAIGVGLGSILGVLLDNLALGIGIGIAIGVGIGAAAGASRAGRSS